MQFPKGTTIAVVDGDNLRVFRNTGDTQKLELQELARPTLEVHAASSGGHRSSSGNPDGQIQGEDGHAAATVAYLNRQVLAGAIEGLYIVAPPRTLGELRKHYHASLKAKLLGELDKEHTGDKVEHLQKALAAA